MGLLLTVLLLNSTKAASQLILKPSADTVEKKFLFRLLPQNFYNQNPGYFCKKEVQLQKLTTLPIYVRLGSKEYVDYLERKPNAIKKD
jgi:hypothetical protein